MQDERTATILLVKDSGIASESVIALAKADNSRKATTVAVGAVCAIICLLSRGAVKQLDRVANVRAMDWLILDGRWFPAVKRSKSGPVEAVRSDLPSSAESLSQVPLYVTLATRPREWAESRQS